MSGQSQQGRPDDNFEFMGSPATNPAGESGRTIGAGSDRFEAPGQNPGAGESTRAYQRTPDLLPPGEDPPGKQAAIKDPGTDENETQFNTFTETETWLIQKSHEIYTASTDYLDANITNQWETNLAHFHNEHAPGTNFRSKNFRRSSVFRPKTRSNVKAQEAGLAHAAFSTVDYCDIQPQNKKDKVQQVSAAVNKELLTYRLDRKLPWFQTVMGAYQDTKVYGICISHQYWDYRIDTDVEPAFDDYGKLIMDDIDGVPTPMGRLKRIVRSDKLCIDNIAPENFRFDPMCDWRDPTTSSPFIVNMVPMYAGEALEMMESEDPKTGQPSWRKHSLGAILGTRRQDYDRTRQAREGRERIDPADEQHGNSFTTVWAHQNIVKINGTDWIWWTMGTELLLTEPVKLRDAYPWLSEQDGERPFVVGFSTIETHRNYPAGDVEQGSGLQEEINLVSNQRLDNVKLALNKRYYVRRGSQVDLDALIRNVPGGGVMMNDPEKDIKTVETNDVTSSSYQEQDRLSIEFDDLAGGVSQASQMQSKGLGETVGKSNMVSSIASAVGDYSIRIFMETWMEPVLRQCVRLIQMYETDQVTLQLAQDNLELWQRFDVDELTDAILMQDLTVRVNVGMGNTDPVRRVEKLSYATEKTMAIPGMAERIKPMEIANEIYGTLGYKDATLFFRDDSEQEEYVEENPPQPPLEVQVKREELQIRDQDNKSRHEREMQKLGQTKEIEIMKLAQTYDLKVEDLKTMLATERQKSKDMRDMTAVREANKTREVNIKQIQAMQPNPQPPTGAQ